MDWLTDARYACRQLLKNRTFTATAVVTLLASLLSDLLYAAADPRIRLEGRR